jgi:hypothetical protein
MRNAKVETELPKATRKAMAAEPPVARKFVR